MHSLVRANLGIKAQQPDVAVRLLMASREKY